MLTACRSFSIYDKTHFWQVGYVLSTHYGVDFRILHVSGNCDWAPHVSKLAQHFQEGGCPVMMGGKTDAASKCIIGTHKDDHLLILVSFFSIVFSYLVLLMTRCPQKLNQDVFTSAFQDPHITGKASMSRKLIAWHSTAEFPTSQNNFYNLCIPLIKWESWMIKVLYVL